MGKREDSLTLAQYNLHVLRSDPLGRRLSHVRELLRNMQEGGISMHELDTSEAELDALRRKTAYAEACEIVDWLKSHPGSSRVVQLVHIIFSEGVRPSDLSISYDEFLRHLRLYLQSVDRGRSRN